LWQHHMANLRQDTLALCIGIVFLAVILSVIWAAGVFQWNVDGVYINFTDPRFPPDRGASWYYWQVIKPTIPDYVTPWICYFAHQFTVWAIIYKAQYDKSHFSPKLRRFNFELLAVNGFFHLVHLAQTHIWYAALAQTVTVWSSQASVIAILIFVLIIQNERRGLFFGQRIPLPKSVVRLVSKYHAYVFAWGAIYTFWYHPMENTLGHLLGFAYTGLLMLQGSLIYTPIHCNKYWILVLELWVLLHAPTISAQKNDGGWALFTFGFLIVAAVTQIFVLPIWPSGKKWFWVRLIPLLIVLGVAFAIFDTVLPLSGIYKITFIPIAEWGLVFLETGIIWVVFRTTNACCPMRNVARPSSCCARTPNEPQEGDNNNETKQPEGRNGLTMRVFGVIFTVFFFFAMMTVALVLQLYALNYDVFLTVFTYLAVGLISPLTFVSAGYALNFRNIRTSREWRKEIQN
jgi:hypothetical protein